MLKEHFRYAVICVLGSEIEPLSHSRDGSSWNWTSHCCVECWQSDERM